MRGPIGYLINETTVINDQTHVYVCEGHDGRFPQKEKKKKDPRCT